MEDPTAQAAESDKPRDLDDQLRKRMSEKSVGRYYKIENLETRDLDCHQLELSQRRSDRITKYSF